LWYFLAILEDRFFSIYLHFLVKAATIKQFEVLRESYRSHVHEAISRLSGVGLKRAQHEFGKASLQIQYRDERLLFIEIFDGER
jgi:hypothetical protein